MNRKYIYGVLLFILPMICFSQKKCYTSINNSVGKESLVFFDNNLYTYTWYRYYDVGPVDDTIMHNGNWSNIGDTFFLTSDYSPNNYDCINFLIEKRIENDSIKIKISQMINDSIPLFFKIISNYFDINGTYFEFDQKMLFGNEMILTIPYFQVNYIYIPGYPVFHVKNKNANYFEFEVKEVTGSKFLFPENTFFLQEKFIKKGDYLYHIKNSKLTENPLILIK